MKTISLIATFLFNLIGVTFMYIAIAEHSPAYAILSGICGGVSYIAFTDFLKAKKKEQIFDKKFIK